MKASAVPRLIVVCGRPGTGKTTLARTIAGNLGACYLRVDAAETALANAGLRVEIEGYAVVHELSMSNLLLGRDVVVDAVNPVPESRIACVDTATQGGAELVMVETSLPDAAEHRRRVEQRSPDLAGQRVPTWIEVVNDGWTPWLEDRDGRRLLIDTTDDESAAIALTGALRGR